MAVHLVATEPEDFIPVLGGTYLAGFRQIVNSSTTTTFRNPTFSRIAMLTRSNTQTFLSQTFTPLSEFWFHTRMHVAAESVTTGLMMEWRSAANSDTPNVRIEKAGVNSSTYRIQVSPDGTSWTTIGANFTIANNTLHTLDVRVKFHASAGAVEVYVNGTQVVNFSGSVTSVNNVVDQVFFTCPSPSHDRYYSEVVVADESTVGWDVFTIVPNASGSNSAWLGAFTDIDEAALDMNDFIQGNLNQTVTYNFNDFAGTFLRRPSALLAISVVGLNATGNGVSNVQAAVRVDGTDYFSSNLGMTPTSGLIVTKALFPTNPLTGGDWWGGYLNTAEIGVRTV